MATQQIQQPESTLRRAVVLQFREAASRSAVDAWLRPRPGPGGRIRIGGEQKYVHRAHRRGKLGWNVGQRVEVMPRYRRSHPALVWTGHGRAVPRIVMRKGSVVHREMLARVPTGFGGEQL